MALPPFLLLPITNTISILTTTGSSTLRKSGGHPKGSTKISLRHASLSCVAALNKIATIYADPKEKNRGKKRVRKGTLEKVIQDVRKKRGLPDNFSISTELIRKQVNRKGLLVSKFKCSGEVYPLLNIEPLIIEVLIHMSRIGESLTPSRAITLTNDMIISTSYQDKLSCWKKIHTSTKNPDDLEEIGYKYWLNFKKRNSDEIITRKGEKYKLDQFN